MGPSGQELEAGGYKERDWAGGGGAGVTGAGLGAGATTQNGLCVKGKPAQLRALGTMVKG